MKRAFAMPPLRPTARRMARVARVAVFVLVGIVLGVVGARTSPKHELLNIDEMPATSGVVVSSPSMRMELVPHHRALRGKDDSAPQRDLRSSDPQSDLHYDPVVLAK